MLVLSKQKKVRNRLKILLMKEKFHDSRNKKGEKFLKMFHTNFTNSPIKHIFHKLTS